MPGWALKIVATLLTGLATMGAAFYAGGHFKNPLAPLHPRVVSGWGGPSMYVGPSVEATDQQPMTFTSVS